MLPQGFGHRIAGFAYTHNETRRDTPHLTIGHTPLSFGGFATSSRGAFAFRCHSASTSATHVTGTVGWMKLFFFFFFSRTSTTSTRSATATSSVWWGRWRTWAGRLGGSAAHRRSPSPFFVDRGHCHWTKKRIYLYSKFGANHLQMPHLLNFAEVCPMM